MGWDVPDVDGAVAELRRRGVTFETVDAPGLRTVDGIADIEGNYPSKGRASAGLGSATARATCSDWANRSDDVIEELR